MFYNASNQLAIIVLSTDVHQPSRLLISSAIQMPTNSSATRPVPLLTESQTPLETHLTIMPNIAKSNTSTYSFTLCDTAAFTTAKSKSITFPRNNATATKHSNIAKLSILRHLHVSSSCIIRGGFLVSMLHCRESHITSLWYL